jgi:hypothetical protein
VGEVPTFRASETDTDLPIVSTDLFNGFQYQNNRFIASKWRHPIHQSTPPFLD